MLFLNVVCLTVALACHKHGPGGEDGGGGRGDAHGADGDAGRHDGLRLRSDPWTHDGRRRLGRQCGARTLSTR
jgi:hypothetical protein